jgi:phosphoribosylformimino-5-aminoimidazole carboxamide ribotide isomerase
MQIIPAIDIIGGKCVRLTEGDFQQKKIYHENPLEVAKMFEAEGITRLHLVDLDGAKAGKVTNWPVLEQIANNCSLKIDFGGGIKTNEEVQSTINAGAAFVTIGSIAVKDEEKFATWLTQFGADTFILGADVRGEQIMINGWQEATTLKLNDFIERNISKGIKQIFCTDVAKDGRLEGPSIDLYKQIIANYPSLFFIASGGVSCLEDLIQLKQIGCKGAIVGKAIYEGKISIKDLAKVNTQ